MTEATKYALRAQRFMVDGLVDPSDSDMLWSYGVMDMDIYRSPHYHLPAATFCKMSSAREGILSAVLRKGGRGNFWNSGWTFGWISGGGIFVPGRWCLLRVLRGVRFLEVDAYRAGGLDRWTRGYAYLPLVPDCSSRFGLANHRQAAGSATVLGKGGGNLRLRLWEEEVKCPRAREDDSRGSGN